MLPSRIADHLIQRAPRPRLSDPRSRLQTAVQATPAAPPLLAGLLKWCEGVRGEAAVGCARALRGRAACEEAGRRARRRSLWRQGSEMRGLSSHRTCVV
eukprot:1609765-Rhodomonas_salina.1